MNKQDALSLFRLKSLDGVDETELKKRFRQLSKMYHPDNVETGNEYVAQQVNKAYDLLRSEMGLGGSTQRTTSGQTRSNGQQRSGGQTSGNGWKEFWEKNGGRATGGQTSGQTRTSGANTKSEVNMITFDEMIKCFKARDTAKFNEGLWVVKFEVKVNLRGFNFTLNTTAQKSLRDEYVINLQLPYQLGDVLKMDFYGVKEDVRLDARSKSVYINYQYLAKVEIHISQYN